MDYRDYQRRQAKALKWAGHFMLGVSVLLLLYAALTGFATFFAGRGGQALLYFVFILIICYSFSSWFSHLANREINPLTFDSEETLLTAGRLLFTSDMHWLRRFHFFSLDGKRVAYVEEEAAEKVRFLFFSSFFVMSVAVA
ncbi:hypothetical protein M3202_10205 [Alkalihalobacillus oceani]|uniref:Uncharacterized protein n=1 Tax=Halalkalibacter oceani TaxID=1653776 RepID=A0A9X2DP24_9BACI|nr:hypothetical protein [Halalkalibacter oceani]MCM3714459.1 hypothetical protein [Halalkalibacter oceani]